MCKEREKPEYGYRLTQFVPLKSQGSRKECTNKEKATDAFLGKNRCKNHSKPSRIHRGLSDSLFHTSIIAFIKGRSSGIAFSSSRISRSVEALICPKKKK